MFLKENNQTPQGFTLIEMLVGLGIIVIMSSIVAVRFDSLRSSTALDGDTEELSSAIRQAQLWALTGQIRKGERPVGGWGIHINECVAPNCSYFIFADVSPSDSPNYKYDAGLDEKIVDITLDSTVFVSSVTPSGPSSDVDVVFSIPEAVTYINGSQVLSESSIVLEHTQTGSTRTIRVDRVSGRINVE